MSDSSPIVHRQMKRRSQKLLEGTVLAVTTLAHPPVRFGKEPRVIALLELSDGSKVMGALTRPCAIGSHVRPRMRLSSINEQKLRIYDVSYEPLVKVPSLEAAFPGYILALTGPSGVGKSTVSRMLVQVFAAYVSPVPILTTRSRKKGDHGEYQYVSDKVFDALLAKNELAAYTDIPADKSEKRRYAYKKSDLQKIWEADKLPVIITEMHLLQGVAKTYGRRSILSFGLLPPGKSKRAMLSALLHRLRERGRETEEQMAHRIKNAEKDLAFFQERKDLFDHVLVNEDLDGLLAMVKERVPALQEA